jgi:hypothetical protein
LGIGIAKSDDDGYVVVCNYFKAGNIFGEFEKNVSPRMGINIKRASKLRKLLSN